MHTQRLLQNTQNLPDSEATWLIKSVVVRDAGTLNLKEKTALTVATK